MGLLLAVLVTAADVDDAKAAATVFARLDSQPMSRVERMFADNKYHNYALYTWVEKHARWELVIVSRPKGSEGWVKLPLRWTVERTFAWLGKCRRLSKDRERASGPATQKLRGWDAEVLLAPDLGSGNKKGLASD